MLCSLKGDAFDLPLALAGAAVAKERNRRAKNEENAP
jgi:hypothetical protein